MPDSLGVGTRLDCHLVRPMAEQGDTAPCLTPRGEAARWGRLAAGGGGGGAQAREGGPAGGWGRLAAGGDAGAAEAGDGRQQGDRDRDQAATEALEAQRLPALVAGNLSQGGRGGAAGRGGGGAAHRQ